jgi:Glycosyltransferase family 87
MLETAPIRCPPLMVNRPILQSAVRGIAVILLGVQLATWTFFLPIALSGHADFRQLYAAGFMLRSGYRHNLYDYRVQKSIEDSIVSPESNALPFNHLAYESLLFAPLSYMPYRPAYLTFLALNVSLLIVTLRILRFVFGLHGYAFWLGICFFPIPVALMQGQDSIILLALFSAAFFKLSQGKEISAGVLIGLGLFKFQLVLPIALLLLCWKRWHFFIGLMASATATIVVSILLVGWHQIELYAGSLIAMSTGLNSESGRVMYGISPADMPNLRGLVYGLTNGHLSGSAQQVIILVVSLVVLGSVATMAKPRTGSEALLVSIPTGAIVSYHLLAHDWSILLIPLFTVVNDVHGDNGSLRGIFWREAIVLTMFLVPLLLAIGRNYFYWGSISVFLFLIVLVQRERKCRLTFVE